MKTTSQVTYTGALRTKAIHLASNNEIITDAPTDNNGKGETFSPTDLVATALASCMLTIMGIRANVLDIDITGTHAAVTKVMASDPRRISEIHVLVTMPERVFEIGHMKVLESAARTCPVALSVHADILQNIEFNWTT